MKTFPLRADLGIFPLPPCRLKWHQKCLQGFVKRVNIKCRKSRTPDWSGWAGGWEAKPPWRYSPGAAKFSQIKQLPSVFPTFPESSFPAFLHPAFPNLQNISAFLQAHLFSLEHQKNPHGLEQEGTLDVFIPSSFLIFFL